MFLLDEKFFNFIHQLAGKSRLIDLVAIFFAQYSGYLLVIIALTLIFSAKKFKDKIFNLAFVSLILLLSRGIFNETIRFFYFRPRPFVRLGFSPLIAENPNAGAFPSGHATFFFALAFSLYYLGYRRWSLMFIIVSVLMGISRVFTGVHWPLDIVFGIIVAFISSYIVNKILLKKQA
jgi:undecaprenyl-diphosphatase